MLVYCEPLKTQMTTWSKLSFTQIGGSFSKNGSGKKLIQEKKKDSKTEELNIYRNMEHCHRSLWTTYIIKFVLEHPLNCLQEMH